MKIYSWQIAALAVGLMPATLDAATVSGTIQYGGLRTGPVVVQAVETKTGNKALKLDGDGDSVRVASVTSLAGSELTIQFWFRGATYQSAVRQQGGGWIVAGWNELHILSNDGGTGGISAGKNVSDGRWHHLVMTWKQNTPDGFASYLDGRLVTRRASSNTAIPDHNAALHLGAFNGAGEYTTGELDEIGVWQRALTETEIAAGWNRPLTGSETGLVGYWNFNDGTANDLSPNSNHGEFLGDAQAVDSDIPGLDAGIGSTHLAAPGGYTIADLPIGPGYAVSAFLDVNDNGQRDVGEPFGEYAGSPFALTTDKPGVDIVLTEIPYFTAQPTSTRAALGSEVVLSATAAGTAPLTYQWRHSDIDLTEGGRFAGTRSAQLRIASLSADDAGVYTLTVSNAQGTATSDGAELNIVVDGKTVRGQFTYDGTQVGPVRSAVTKIRTGNQALQLGGQSGNTGDYAVTTLTDLSGSELSIEFWFKGSVVQSAIRQQSGGWVVAGWNNKVILSNDGGVAGADLDPNVTDGTWHHVAMTWKQGTANGFATYLDGRLTTARNSADVPIPNHNAQVYFGSWVGSAEFTKGLLDEIAIWHRALTPSEIRTHMRSGLLGSEAGLAGYWNFDDGIGQDLSPAGNNAEVRNNAAIVPVENPGMSAQYVDTFSGPGPYVIPAIPPGTGYALNAFLDADGNGRMDPGEPRGAYPGNPFDLTADKTGADVALYDPPVIVTQPSSVGVPVGGTLVLRVVAQGSAPLAYQWRKAGLDLVDGGRISGAQTAELRITAAELGDEPAYSVRVSNPGGTVDSAVAAVVVGAGNMADRLIGHWKFDETSGTVAAESSGQSPAGDLFNFTDDSQWVAGVVGGALKFGGALDAQYVLVPDYPKPSTTISAAVWAWADSYPTWASILKNWGSSQSGQIHFGLQDNTGRLSQYISEGSGAAVSAIEEALFPLGSWQHVAFVCDGSRVRLYRNGLQVASSPYDGTLLNPPPMSSLGIGVKPANDGLGADTELPAYWPGKMDDLGLWSRALTASEVYGIYQAGLAGKDLTKAVPASPEIRLSIAWADTQLEIGWPSGTLESAPAATGPWTTVAGATAPSYRLTPSAGVLFFRVSN
jgi:hypothetical protein